MRCAHLVAAILGFAILGLNREGWALSPSSPTAQAQQISQVQRGVLKVLIRAEGTVRAEDIFRLKSTIEGRVESILVSTHTWSGPDRTLATLATKDFAALLDSKTTTPKAIVQQRWEPIFQMTPIRCPYECFVLRVFARLKTWVEPQAILFEAAGTLRLVGRIRAGDAHWIQEGQLLRFWDRKNPKRRLQGRVEKFVLDVPGEKVDPGGMFTVLLDSKHYLEPGTEWRGYIIAKVKKDALYVPTAALIEHKGELFLPVRVSTGITTYDVTEIAAGASEKQKILFLEPGRLGANKIYGPRPLKPGEVASPPFWWGRRAHYRSMEDWPEGAEDFYEDLADYPSDLNP